MRSAFGGCSQFSHVNLPLLPFPVGFPFGTVSASSRRSGYPSDYIVPAHHRQNNRDTVPSEYNPQIPADHKRVPPYCGSPADTPLQTGWKAIFPLVKYGPARLLPAGLRKFVHIRVVFFLYQA